jgi:hypothetical protein
MADISDAGISLRRIRSGRKCWAFAGMCVLLLSGSSFVGLAILASGEGPIDLVADDENNWKAQDIFTQPSGVPGWYVRKPVQTDVGLELSFNQASSGEFTVYFHNIMAEDLTGMKIRAVFEIRQDSTEVPLFIARADDSAVQMRLQFQTTSGSWEPEDYWWSYYSFVTLTSYAAGVPTANTKVLNTELTFEVPLDPALWLRLDGVLGSTDVPSFEKAVADIQEIGLSFGRSESYASGVALTQGEATLVLKHYEILPLNSAA